MDKAEAKRLLMLEMEKLIRVPYAIFADWIERRHVEILEPIGSSGTEYCVEVEAFWDGVPHADICVLGSIDDGGLWAAMKPLCASFLLSPDGTLQTGWEFPART